MLVSDTVSSDARRRKRVVRLRLIGSVLLVAYWTSFYWLKPVFAAFGLLPLTSRTLARCLELYFAPPLLVLRWLGGVLTYPVYLFYGPIIAVGGPLIVMMAAWWVAWTLVLRKMSGARNKAAEE